MNPRTPRLLLFALLMLLPLLASGIFNRAFWTPDEPREADIAWLMSTQQDRSLARFGAEPWLEKPPLSYWMAGAAIATFGDTPAAARVPNALYALTVAAAVFALAASLAGAQAALIASLVAGSALLAWRVAIWLAPDAPLMAGAAVALLGAWRGYAAQGRAERLFWYTVMHAGAAFGFMAKSAVGWLVPALPLATLILWERRWREIVRPELWAGLALQAALIGPWLWLVLREPAGAAHLKSLFWNNLAGRFADVPTYGGPRYAVDHRNYPGKYFLELPVYLLPWTALGVAALWRARHATRLPAAPGRAWRFALAASLPWLLLLSVSATARDVYAAPALPGFALLIALLLAEDGSVRVGAPRRAERITLAIVLLLGLVLLGAGALLLLARESWSGADAARLAVLGAILATLGVVAVRFRAALRAGSRFGPALLCYVGFALPMTLWSLGFFPLVDEWQDLSRLSSGIARDLGTRPFALLAPDETTLGIMEHGFGFHEVVQAARPGEAASLAAAAGAWLRAHGRESRLLVKLPGSAPGELSRWIGARTGRRLWSEDDGPAAGLERAGVARIVERYQLPQGRRYALLASP